MLLTLVEFLLRSLISIVGFIFLLRAWLYVWAFSPRHPFVMFVRRVSDWWSNPVSRIIPPQGAFDWPNLLGAFLAAILTVVLHACVIHPATFSAGMWIIAPFAMLLRWALEMVGWFLIIYMFTSWVNPQSPMHYLLGTLLDPFLRPMRRLPLTIGRFDFAPLLLFILLLILQSIVLSFSQGGYIY